MSSFNQFSSREPLTDQGKYALYDYALRFSPNVDSSELCFNASTNFQGICRSGGRAAPLNLIDQEGVLRIRPFQYEQKGFLIDEAETLALTAEDTDKTAYWKECDVELNGYTRPLKADLPTWSLRSDNVSSGFNRSVYPELGRNTQQELKDFYKQKQQQESSKKI